MLGSISNETNGWSAEGVNNVLWHSVALYLEREKRVHLEGLEDGSLIKLCATSGKTSVCCYFLGRSEKDPRY